MNEGLIGQENSGFERDLYQALLRYFDENLIPNGITQPQLLAFKLSDGSFKFSLTDAIDVLERLVLESHASQRLLVIVSVAYLEDQLHILLESFLADEDVSEDLLSPVNGSVAALVPMANLAYALGLIPKEWLTTLKQLAKLRNKFAHLPRARDFVELTKLPLEGGRMEALMVNLVRQYQSLAGLPEDSQQLTLDDIYPQLFLLMYKLIQFSIDHVAVAQRRMTFQYSSIIGVTHLMGLTRADVRDLLDDQLAMP